MNLDKILLIPYLSKELNLIGYKTLPFKFKRKVGRRRYKLEEDDESSESDLEEEKEPVEIVFNARKMISRLVTVSIKLVNQVKSLGFLNTNDEIDKLQFENIKLEKQLNQLKREMEKKLDEIAVEKEKNRQMTSKIDSLLNKLKHNEMESKKLAHKWITSENILKHNLKRQESNVRDLHKIIWKQFNMSDKNYFPDNFEFVHVQQPDFSKLWSDVRYSRPATREDALKKAVCIFQENNNMLMEDVRLLKNLLLITLDELNDFVLDISEKMHLNHRMNNSLKYKINELFENADELKVDAYRNIIQQHFSFVRNVLNDFDSVSFTVSEKLFVCWTDLISRS